MNSRFEPTLFTKHWGNLALKDLAVKVRSLGFQGIELPVRPGFQVEPEEIEIGLREAVRVLAEEGVEIRSIAAPHDERTIAACADVGIRMIRILAPIPKDVKYLDHVDQLKKRFDTLEPLLSRHGVTIGVQNHCGRWVSGAMGLRHLIGNYNPAQFAAVWDPAHNALNGEPIPLALDIIESHLLMVNLKCSYWRPKNGGVPGSSGAVEWEHYWVTGEKGMANWPLVFEELQKRAWSGPCCFSAEYSEEEKAEEYTVHDLKFFRQLTQ
jgi:sugar phosphate isomerase/epimerase